ncbi:MAG TPA: sulfurtransferase [Rhodospirillales bacterium]|jgi:thiosulfate/3-mercaptopyruvate sulfurtransferase|nr:sulfurtransferase [Rhodospirillales bacterium]
MNKLKLLVISSIIFLGISNLVTANPLVNSIWLKKNITNPKVVKIDLRNKIDGGSYQTYLKGHIPGSVHSDYLKDGWRTSKNGVVGLVPSAEQFQALARKLGVSSDSHVILIPAGVSSSDFGSSARAYWSFKAFGHSNVSILDGGYRAWSKKFPTLIEKNNPNKINQGNFVASFKPNSYISTENVAGIVEQQKDVILVDGRTEDQFLGKAKHKKAKLSGRIPGALHLSQANSYDTKSNRLKDQKELESIYSIIDSKPIVSYCNTGHWAATNWFVLSEVLGKKNVKLYDGSMVEWTANKSNPVIDDQSNLQKIKGFFKNTKG